MTTIAQLKTLKRTNRTRAEVILLAVAKLINGIIIPDGKDTIIMAGLVALGTNNKTPVPSRFCSQKYWTFYSISGNPYPGYDASSYYGQQQQYGERSQFF
jgi:hypothetical protein